MYEGSSDMEARRGGRPRAAGLRAIAGGAAGDRMNGGGAGDGDGAAAAAAVRPARGAQHAAADDAPLKVVLVESDPGCLAALRAAVAESGGAAVAGEAVAPEHGLREVMKARPDLVIVGLDEPEVALALTERLAEIYPDTALFLAGDAASAELVKRAMRAGVREYLGRPPEAAEVQAALRRLLRQRAQATSARRLTGEIIAVFAAKGGIGATFLASNLAVLLASTGERRTAVVDLNLELGDVATFLNLKPAHSILDVVDAGGRLDATLLESALATHPSGLRLLAQPEAAADAERVSASEIGQVLTRLKTMFEYVVVDTQRRFDERTLEALDLADHILFLVALDLPTIRNARRCLEVFTRLGYADRLQLVVNRHRPSKGSERLERSFGIPVAFRLPDDYATSISSINAGVPATEAGPETELAQALRSIASSLSGQGEAALAAAPERGRGGLLKRFLPG